MIACSRTATRPTSGLALVRSPTAVEWRQWVRRCPRSLPFEVRGWCRERATLPEPGARRKPIALGGAPAIVDVVVGPPRLHVALEGSMEAGPSIGRKEDSCPLGAFGQLACEEGQYAGRSGERMW